jgi:hypothetical protein
LFRFCLIAPEERGDGGAHRGTLAGITGDGAADGPDRGTPRRPMHCSALLWRRRGGGLRRCGRIEAVCCLAQL